MSNENNNTDDYQADQEAMSLFGSGKTGASERTKWFNVPNTDQGETPIVCKILPPFASLAQNQRGWFQYYSLMFGYIDTTGKERPFQTPYKVDYKTKMVTTPCAAIAKSEQANAHYELLQRNLTPTSSADERTVVEAARRRKMKLAPNKKYYMNIQTDNKDFGVLSIGYKGFTMLEEMMGKCVSEYGLNPVSAETGVFFKFWKKGNGFDTTYHVELVLADYASYEQDPTDGTKIKVIKKIPTHTPLTTAEMRRIAAEASLIKDLALLYPKPSSDEVAYIVAGGPAELERVLGSPFKSKASEASKATSKPAAQYSAPVPALEVASAVSVFSQPTPATPVAQTVVETPVIMTTPDTAPVIEATPAKSIQSVDFNNLTPTQLQEFLSTGKLSV